MGVITAPRYGLGNTLLVGGSVAMTVFPTEANGLEVVPVGFTVRGTDASDTAKASVCTVNNDATSSDFGKVVASGSAVSGDKCVVTVAVKALGYEEKDAPAVTLALGAALNFNTAPVVTWNDGENPPGNCLLRRASDDTCVADTTGLPSSDDSTTPVAVTWHYWASGKDGNGVSKEGVCSVVNNPGNSAHGDLSVGSSGVVGDVCRVQAFAKASGYDDYTAVAPVVLTVGKGLLSFARAILPDYRILRDGGRVAPVGENFVDDNGVAVEWGSWSGVGSDKDNDGTADDANVCSVDSTTGVVSAGSAASLLDTCTVSAVASADGYEDSEAVRIKIITIYRTILLSDSHFLKRAPVYDGSVILRGEPLAFSTGPSLDPLVEDREVTWTYTVVGKRGGAVPNPAQDICSVDANTGAVSAGSDAVAGDTCEITSRATAPGAGMADAPAVTVTLKDTFTSLTWKSFPTSAEVGQSVDLSLDADQPVSVPEGFYDVNVVSGDCSYDGIAFVFSGVTECVVRVTVSKLNYMDTSRVFRVTPGPGTIQIQSVPNYGDVRFSADTNPPSISTTPSSTTKTYALADDSVGCTVTTGGVVRGTVVGNRNCKVVVTLSASLYKDRTHTYTISVIRAIQPNTALSNWSNPYGSNPTVVYGSSSVDISGSVPTGYGSVQYRIKPTDASKCGFLISGTVTASSQVNGTCVAQARFAGNTNYRPSEWTDIATITIQAN